MIFSDNKIIFRGCMIFFRWSKHFVLQKIHFQGVCGFFQAEFKKKCNTIMFQEVRPPEFRGASLLNNGEPTETVL